MEKLRLPVEKQVFFCEKTLERKHYRARIPNKATTHRERERAREKGEKERGRRKILSLGIN